MVLLFHCVEIHVAKFIDFITENGDPQGGASLCVPTFQRLHVRFIWDRGGNKNVLNWAA